MTKTDEEIRGLGKNPEDNCVQNSMALINVLRKMPLVECQLLEAYLGRINSHDPQHRMVRFEKGEFERVFQRDRISPDLMRDRMKRIMSVVVEVDDPNSKRHKMKFFPLFDLAVCEQDETGVWMVSMRCSEEALKSVFNLENIHYIRYKLRCVIPLRSKYSLRLFLYIENNRHMHSDLTWEVSLDELKTFLGCQGEKTYEAYKEFNKQILKRAAQELNEQTECHFTYTPVRRSRTVVGVRFILESLQPAQEEQIAISDASDCGTTPFTKKIAVYCHNKFSENQCLQIASVLLEMDEATIPEYNPDYNMEQRRLELLGTIFAKYETTAKKKEIEGKPIKAPFPYFMKMLRNTKKDTYQPVSDQGMQAKNEARLQEDMDWLMQYRDNSQQSEA